MEKDQELKELLKEVSSAISDSLSAPGTVEKLEELQKKGYQLYLVMENSAAGGIRAKGSPIMPIEVTSGHKPTRKNTDEFDLSDEDKNFLRTLKIKVD